MGTEMDNPKEEEQHQQNTSALGKLKLGFSKIIQSNTTKEDMEKKLENARAELPKYIKVFEETKKQLLESINIVEEKLNVEVVYYVQQFYRFVKEWKSGNVTLNEEDSQNQMLIADDGDVADMDNHDADDEEEVVVQEIEQNE